MNKFLALAVASPIFVQVESNRDRSHRSGYVFKSSKIIANQ
jgi:hypothetical protein